MARRHSEPKPGWRWEDDWRQARLMDWLTTPVHEREPRTKTELASVLGVTTKTLQDWHEHPQFRAAWDARVSELIGDPERAQNVIDTLYRAATDPNNRSQVQAAKLYLEATNSIKPPQLEVTVKRPTELSDAELDALLAQGAAALREERGDVNAS